MNRHWTTVRKGRLEDVLDVILPLVPEGVFERPAGEGEIEVFWYDDADAPPPGLERLEIAQEPAPADRVARRQRFGAVWEVGGRFAIRVPDAPPARAGLEEILVVADRGQFGTGAHPTTSDSLELLLHVEPGGSLADLGCGAGVLAIVGARLGFAPVVAVDFEPGSVRATKENAARNATEIDVRLVDLLQEPPPAAATVVANVPLAVHRRVAERLTDEVRTLIVSGVVSGEAPEAVAAYGARGLWPTRRKDSFGWASILLERE